MKKKDLLTCALCKKPFEDGMFYAFDGCKNVCNDCVPKYEKTKQDGITSKEVEECAIWVKKNKEQIEKMLGISFVQSKKELYVILNWNIVNFVWLEEDKNRKPLTFGTREEAENYAKEKNKNCAWKWKAVKVI